MSDFEKRYSDKANQYFDKMQHEDEKLIKYGVLTLLGAKS
jgi:hypothetical protein